MSQHTAIIRWKNSGPDFLKRRYSRAHKIHFDGGAVVQGSPSPQVVSAPWSDPSAVDPEEAFVASVASCHMLWFLHEAIDAGFEALSYEDQAIGEMTPNTQGKLWISRVTLQPRIQWVGTRQPSNDDVLHLHHLAHDECFIANSIKTEVIVATP
jgi:organic hydroperoxide reductase OsmC/OhrA